MGINDNGNRWDNIRQVITYKQLLYEKQLLNKGATGSKDTRCYKKCGPNTSKKCECN